MLCAKEQERLFCQQMDNAPFPVQDLLILQAFQLTHHSTSVHPQILGQSCIRH